jgi:hypothetical protein
MSHQPGAGTIDGHFAHFKDSAGALEVGEARDLLGVT